MRLTKAGGGLFAFLLAVAGSGCQSIRGASGTGSSLHPPDFISQDRRDRAEALAHFSQGLIYEIHREFEAALAEYREAIAYDPGNEELHFRLAMGLLHEQRHAEAVELMETLAGDNPDSIRALRWLALIYRAAGDAEKSEATYREWIKRAPDDTAAYIQLAALFVKNERAEDAVLLLEKAAKTVADPKELLQALADLFLRRSADSEDLEVQKAERAKAIEVLERLVNLDAEDPAILNKLGELYMLNHDLEKAIAFYEGIQARQPDNLRVKEKLAESFLAMGDRDKAVEVLENIAALQPGNQRVHFYLGELFQQMGDTDRAAESFRVAIQVEPQDPAGYLRLAILLMVENPAAAIQVLQDGLKMLPGNVTLTKTLASVYFAEQDYPNAVASYEDALERMENDDGSSVGANFYFNFAIAAQRAGKIERAAELLSLAMDENMAFMDAYVQFVFRAEEDRDAVNGLAVLGELAKRRNDEPRVYYYLGVVNNYLQAYADAVAAFERTETLATEQGEASELLGAQFYFWFGAACERDGQFTRAEDLFAKSLELDDEYAEAYNYLAYMWAERGIKLDKAMEYVTKALALQPESGAFIDTLGWIYYQRGKYEAALAEIERAAERMPDDPTVTDHYGDILLKLSGVDEALPQWKRSFVLDPENETVGQKLSEHGVDLGPLRDEAALVEAEREAEAEKERVAPEPEVEPEPEAPAPEGAAPEKMDEIPPLDGNRIKWPMDTEPAGPVEQMVPAEDQPKPAKPVTITPAVEPNKTPESYTPNVQPPEKEEQ